MAKLLIKREIEEVSWLKQFVQSWPYMGMLLLLLTAATLIVWQLQTAAPFSPITSDPDSKKTLSLDSASDKAALAAFLTEQEQLRLFEREYQLLLKQNIHEWESHLVLSNHVEMVLQHLAIMDELIEPMGLSSSESKDLQAEQRYLKDEWQAKQHFHELRLSSLQPEALQTEGLQTIASQQVSDVDTTPPVAASRFAVPPDGVELPPGFCTLGGSGACKPDASN
ncbi:MAG: hypothetical protein CR991_05590 [Proteobacteria bacterium]|nr:MAG: hypothetical protein CR991_05590 [Pseudomonadota bacterium]